MDIRAYGYKVGKGKTGKYNRLTDVPGVSVGHCTVDNGKDLHTGVTVILPCEGSVFQKKPVAAVFVQNGYGKTAGLMQVEELGTLEAPIALTGTLNVGRVLDAMVGCVLEEEAAEGNTVYSLNVVVGETNDGRISNLSRRPVGETEVRDALRAAREDGPMFAEGAVGAGRGTICCGFKGGIGSSSRLVAFGGKIYTLGVLVQSNFGAMGNFILCGKPLGKQAAKTLVKAPTEDKGSIMMVLGTDLPLTARQLKRVLKRMTVGLSRTGSFLGNGSGDVFIGFTNGNYAPETRDEEFLSVRCLPENKIDRVFTAAAEAAEEAILNSMSNAKACHTLEGKEVHSLAEFL